MATILLLTSCLLITDSAVDEKVGVGAGGDADTDSDTEVDTDTASGADADGDGYGLGQGDCDDADPAVNPGEAEDCSTPADDNCDGSTNDVHAIGCSAFYPDSDGDGYGEATSECLCIATPDFPATNGADCDDTNGATNPGSAEVCRNGIDDNCDGGPDACELSGGSLSTADAKYSGELEQAAKAVAGAGDVNGDGYGDVLVAENPVVHLVLGSAVPAGIDLATSNAHFTPESGSVYAISGAGDVNADGFADVLVGVPSSAEEPGGAAYLLLGSASPASVNLRSADAIFTGEEDFTGEPAGGYAGCALAAAGDVNGDGRDDMIVGACGLGGDNRGAAYLVLGSASPASMNLRSADAKFESGAAYGTAGWNAGFAVAGANDFDADGLDDILVGSQAHLSFLILGSTSPSDLELESADASYTGHSDYAGLSLDFAGDFNSDGYSDVLLGAYGEGGYIGAAYLILGSAAPASLDVADSDASYFGEFAYDYAGASVAGIGDTDRDGYDDIVVGARLNDGGATDAGAAYLIRGSASPASGGLATADARFTGETASNYAGIAVGGAGDVDADGYDDFLVGATGNGSWGAAYLLLGTGI